MKDYIHINQTRMLKVIEDGVENECRQIYGSGLGYDIRYAYEGTVSLGEAMQIRPGGFRMLHPKAIDDESCCKNVLCDGQGERRADLFGVTIRHRRGE